jgi:hypothetical protein
MIEPEDVADRAVFLASERSRLISVWMVAGRAVFDFVARM